MKKKCEICGYELDSFIDFEPIDDWIPEGDWWCEFCKEWRSSQDD